MEQMKKKYLVACDLGDIVESDIIEMPDDYTPASDNMQRLKLSKFPCKVGDTVYKTISSTKIVEIKIESIFITANGINISGRETKTKCSVCISLSDFGETVFLTKDRKSQ